MMELFTDYFLRYSVEVPADEVSRHQKFSRDCPCKPSVHFDDSNGWHYFTHQPLEGETGADEIGNW